MPKSVETVFIALVVVGVLVYFYLEDRRLDDLLQQQQQELELVQKELQETIDNIQADLKAGKINHQQASELMQQASKRAQQQNLETLERTMEDIVPGMEVPEVQRQ